MVRTLRMSTPHGSIDKPRSVVPIVPIRSYVAGRWIESMEDSGQSLHDPNTGEVRQAKLVTPAQDVERAIASSRQLYNEEKLETIGLQARVDLLLAVAEILEQDRKSVV